MTTLKINVSYLKKHLKYSKAWEHARFRGRLLLSSEAVFGRCSVNKVFLKISQNSQKNICARFFFLIKLQAFSKKRLWWLLLSVQHTSKSSISMEQCKKKIYKALQVWISTRNLIAGDRESKLFYKNTIWISC